MIFEPVMYKRSGGTSIIPTKITIDIPPTKKEYKIGETFNPDGMEVWIDFSNGKSLYVLNSDLTFSPTELTNKSIDSVSVTFNWGETKVSATQTIIVRE